MKEILLIIFTFLSLTGFGQENYMSLTFGTASPLGDFKEASDITSDGFALQGFIGEYTGAYYYKNYIGLKGEIKFTSNLLNQSKAREKLDELLPELPDSIEADYTLSHWTQVGFFIGPQFTLPVGKLRIDAWILGGLNFIMAPEMEIRGTIDDEFIYYKLSDTKISFGFDTGLGLRYVFNESYGINLYTSYFQSKSKGEALKQVIDSGEEIQDFTRKIHSFNVGIGIVYLL